MDKVADLIKILGIHTAHTFLAQFPILVRGCIMGRFHKIYFVDLGCPHSRTKEGSTILYLHPIVVVNAWVALFECTPPCKLAHIEHNKSAV